MAQALPTGISNPTCEYCGEEFSYDVTQPRKKFCEVACRRSSENERRKGRKDSHRARTAKNAIHEPTFIGVDGEGVTRMGYVDEWDDEESNMVTKYKKVHDYVLFSVGDQSLYHDDGSALNHAEIFEFLYEQKLENPTAVFVGFFLGYDFSQWLKTMPASRGFSLFHKDGIARRMPNNPEMKYPFPVQCGDWEFDILGMKRFKLRPHIPRKDWPQCTKAHKSPDQQLECETGKHREHPYKWMFICDTGAFFQTSLLNAIDPKGWAEGTAIVSDSEMATLVAGKADRSGATFDSVAARNEMIKYNVLENDVLGRLMSLVNKGFVADGIRLRADQWYGPGQAAQAWLRLIGAPSGEEVREAVPVWAMEAGRKSYYGGWFETFIHGPIPGITYDYDINSAYPYIISTLPCLLHGTWIQGTGKPKPLAKGRYRLVYGHYKGNDQYIGTMPHRAEDGSISRRSETIGWHWQHEIDAARRAGMVKSVRVIEWVEYIPCHCPPPLGAIAVLYEGRLKVGKDTPFGKSKKLVYNSSYGKMAQSIGMPKYANSIYASLITAGCRTMITDAIATHPGKTSAVAMIATDGIVFTSPHPSIPIHKTELGKWGADEKHNLSILMPGLYWDDKSRASTKSGQNMKLKSRGVSGKYLAPFIDEFDAAWIALRDSLTAGADDSTAWEDEAPCVSINIEFGVISPRLAVARDAWQTCGAIEHDKPRVISANPEKKRAVFYRCRNNPDLLRTHVFKVWDMGSGIPETTYYDKTFGSDEIDDNGLKVMNYILNQDGNITDIIHAVLPS